jgi:hypothetical protein
LEKGLKRVRRDRRFGVKMFINLMLLRILGVLEAIQAEHRQKQQIIAREDKLKSPYSIRARLLEQA